MVRYDKDAAARGRRHIEDRRGSGARLRRPGSSGLPVGRVGGIGGLVLVLLAVFLGGNALTSDGGSSSGFDIGAAEFDETNTVDVSEPG